jgi:hypothetical protein
MGFILKTKMMNKMHINNLKPKEKLFFHTHHNFTHFNILNVTDFKDVFEQ